MTVSIITISYNSERTIEETIKSVLKEKNENLEYIVIDGLSTDGTMGIIGRYKDGIDVVVSEKDDGISDAFNKGIMMASGEVIGLINSDDQLYPGAIKHIVDNYENGIDVYYGDAVIIDRKYGREFYRKAFDLKEMEYCLPFFHQSCFIAKRAYEKYGLYDKKYKHCMDYDLIRKMYSQSARFFYIGEILSKFSWGGVSSTEWMQTTLEDVKIAIRYGLPRYKGLFFFVKTILRAALKRTLEATGLFACVAKIRDRKRSIPKE